MRPASSLAEERREPTRPQTLAGLTFVLTGALERFTRDEAGAALKELGAKVVGQREQEDVVRGGRRGRGQQVRQGGRARRADPRRGRLGRIIESGEAPTGESR